MDLEGKKEHIMIVDDNPKNLQLLGRLLQEEGYKVSLAQNGIQALNAIEIVLPDIILLDIMMPEMDGYETCKKLKSLMKTKDIPVIFLTAKTETSDIVKGFDIGAVDYVSKPLNSAELLARIRTHLELKLYRTNLEALVIERTNILHKKNEELKHLLSEKKLLLNEIHHRVYNNLQIITGLYYLETERYDDEQIERIIIEHTNRINSIATVHSLLYEENNFIEIEFSRFIYKLFYNLRQVYKINESSITLTVNDDCFKLNINLAVPFGLIMNEVLSQFIKFIKNNDIAIQIDVSLTGDSKKYTGTITTSGLNDVIDVLTREDTFEHELINLMLIQLGGEIVRKENSLIITFISPPLVSYNERS